MNRHESRVDSSDMISGRAAAPIRRRVIGPYPFLDTPRPLAFAHRGGAGDGDENTMDAFGRAVSAGYRYIETDARASADGVAVLFHDDDLTRVLGMPTAVESLSWPELSRLKLNGQALVPRLDEALLAWPNVRFNIDVKSDRAVKPTLAAIRSTGAMDRTLIGSFNDARIAAVRRLAGPRLATSMAQGEIARLWLASRYGRWWYGFNHQAPAAQVPVTARGLTLVDHRFITYAHRLGMQVHVWTIDDPNMMEELLNLGVDGIMTDRIETLRHVYRSRGHWRD